MLRLFMVDSNYTNFKNKLHLVMMYIFIMTIIIIITSITIISFISHSSYYIVNSLTHFTFSHTFSHF